MLGTLKAALAAALTALKASIPIVGAVTATTAVLAASIYQKTVDEGIYEKSSSNVRYVIEQCIDDITIDSIVYNDNGGYSYSTEIDKKVNEMLTGNEKVRSIILSYIDNENPEELIKKFIRAEIISQYPDLRSEAEIRNNMPYRENELQGGIKVVRPSSSISSSSNSELKYEISADDKILVFTPYNTFSQKIANNDSSVSNYFSLNNSGDIVVAGWTKQETITETIEYIPNENAADTVNKNNNSSTPLYRFYEVKINYKNSLNKYSMPAGFLWSILVTTGNLEFVEKLADLAINNTNIIVEAQDNISVTQDINVQKYKAKKELTKTIVANDGTTRTETSEIIAQNESTIKTIVKTEESKTNLNLTYAETWVATYKVDFYNTASTNTSISDEWQNKANWTSLEDTYIGANTIVSSSPNTDTGYTQIKNNLISGITEEKCGQELNKKIQSLNNTNILYYLFNESTAISKEAKTYIYNNVKNNSTSDDKSNISNTVKAFWDNKSEEANTYYSEKNIKEIMILSELYVQLDNIANNIKTLKSAQTKADSYNIQNKTASYAQTSNLNVYTSAGTKVQERVEIEEENNFVTYLNNIPNVKNAIMDSNSKLYKMLESHEKTANMMDLFKYLLYQSYNLTLGLVSFDFGIGNVSNYNSIGSAVIGDTVEEKVWFTLKANGLSDIAVAAVMGNIYGESAFNPLAVESNGEGIGLCQWSFGRKEQLIKYAESKGTTWQDVNTQIEFLLGEINKNGGANGYAKFQMGVTYYGYNYESWCNGTDLDTATKAFMAVFERPNMNLAHTDTRCNKAKTYLQAYEGKTISGGTYVPDGKDGIIGHFTSNITGRTFTIYNQNHAKIALRAMCHRAVAASIASGYKGTMTDMQVIEDVKKAGDYVLSQINVAKAFFDKYGLDMRKNEYPYSIENMRTILTQRKYIAIWFDGPAKGKSGATYSGGVNNVHWIAILGYKYENGKEQIFISDPGWESSGWKDIDEFEVCKSVIKNFHTIYEK